MTHPIDNAINDTIHQYREVHGHDHDVLTDELLELILRAARDTADVLTQQAIDEERETEPLTPVQRARAEAFSQAAMAYTPASSAFGHQTRGLPTDPTALAAVCQAAEWILGAPPETRSVQVNVYNPTATVVDKVRTVDPTDPEVEDDGFITVALTPDGEQLQVRPKRPEPRS